MLFLEKTLKKRFVSAFFSILHSIPFLFRTKFYFYHTGNTNLNAVVTFLKHCNNKIFKMLPRNLHYNFILCENFVMPVLSYMPNGENPKEDGNVANFKKAQEELNFLFRQQSRKIGLQKEAVSRTDRRLQTSPAVVSITYEEIGLFPRSFSRVFDRFIKQVFSDVENLVIQEYRFYRYLFLTTLKCLFLLIFLPFLVNLLAKQILVQPFTEYFWNTKQSEIFLNSYQQKRAFEELQDFEEKLYFESLLPTGQSILGDAQKDNNISFLSPSAKNRKSLGDIPAKSETNCLTSEHCDHEPDKNLIYSIHKVEKKLPDATDDSVFSEKNLTQFPNGNFLMKDEEKDSMTHDWDSYDLKKIIEQRLQQKTVELAIRYNNESIEAITNFFADLFSLMTLGFLFFALEIQINITKSFLLEVFFGLDDSKKSLMILLVTDLLVGYHSSNLWELFFQFLFNHYGLPENQTGIFLLVATFPVLLDVLFKYLIFRHLNRASPATVATYHAMIE
uniref:Potassium/proton antiporter CemA n=1 Tax=Carteria sp. SAG 8-5 TaxID=1756294 RepID=A0A0S2LPD4_9CHLO|nr:chloroplast enveloppe membrane protein [Carteria sp. SAG 8-5]